MASLCLLLVLIRLAMGETAAANPKLEWALLAIAGTLGLRFLVYLRLGRPVTPPREIGERHLGFVFGSTLTALGILVLNVLAFPLLTPYSLTLLLVCEAGIAAAALVSMAGSPLAYTLYLLPILGSDVFLAWQHRSPQVLAPIFPLIIAFFMVTLVALSLDLHRNLRDNILMRLKLQEMALVDTLTGLRNRRYLREFLGVETARIRRMWHPGAHTPGDELRTMSLIMVDLDHFKSVNDSYGHAIGDEVLVQTARVLARAVRDPDLVIRWGGEEFLIVATGTHRAEPLALAERIRRSVGKHSYRLSSGGVLEQTCTVGFAGYPFLGSAPGALTWEQVLHLADCALYEAKRRGRNRVLGVAAGEASPKALLRLAEQGDKELGTAIETGILRWIQTPPMPLGSQPQSEASAAQISATDAHE